MGSASQRAGEDQEIAVSLCHAANKEHRIA